MTDATSSRRMALIPWLLRGVSAIPPLAVFFLIRKLAVNVPFQDDWDIVPLLASFREGTSILGDVWQQHSEHRIPVVNLLIWLIGKATAYNVIAEMIVGFAFSVLTLIVVHKLIARSLEIDAPGLIWPMTAAASLLLFSLALRENWFWGLASVQLFLLNLTTVTVIWILTLQPDRWHGLALGIVAALVGTFTEASGVVLWLTGAAAIGFSPRIDRRRKTVTIIVWTAIACATAVAYAWGLNWEGSSLAAAASHVDRLLVFAAACLGLPFAYGTSPVISAAFALMAITGLVLAVELIHERRRAMLRRLIPMFLLAGHGLVVVTMIAVGRSELDSGYAMASHYGFGPTLFWIGAIVIASVASHIAWPAFSRAGKLILGIAVAIVAGALGTGYAGANGAGYEQAYDQSRNLEMALASLYSESPMPEGVSDFLYPPDDLHLQRQIAALKALKSGPFAASEEAQTRLISRFDAREASGHPEGMLDGGDCQRVRGWAWDPSRPDAPVMVDIWQQGRKIGTVPANWFRTDLLKAGIGNGQHAFIFTFPTASELGAGQMVTVTYGGTRDPVRNSPKAIMCR